jgi:hypothetical protein
LHIRLSPASWRAPIDLGDLANRFLRLAATPSLEAPRSGGSQSRDPVLVRIGIATVAVSAATLVYFIALTFLASIETATHHDMELNNWV